jgi:hypothetical protein
MQSKIEKEVRFLKVYAVVSTICLAALFVSAFTMQTSRLAPDGTPKLEFLDDAGKVTASLPK